MISECEDRDVARVKDIIIVRLVVTINLHHMFVMEAVSSSEMSTKLLGGLRPIY
jgi:hypothetical protein